MSGSLKKEKRCRPIDLHRAKNEEKLERSKLPLFHPQHAVSDTDMRLDILR